MSPQEFSAAWGDGLVPFTPSELQAAPISEPLKRFLMEAGLPEEADPSLIFYPPPDAMAPIPDVVPSLGLPEGFRRYLVLADDGGLFLCADTKSRECVLAVDPYQEARTRFVNSTVPKFAEYLLAYRRVKPGPGQAEAASKQEIKGWNDRLKAQFNEIDPVALSDPNNWWAVIVEELDIFTR